MVRSIVSGATHPSVMALFYLAKYLKAPTYRVLSKYLQFTYKIHTVRSTYLQVPAKYRQCTNKVPKYLPASACKVPRNDLKSAKSCVFPTRPDFSSRSSPYIMKDYDNDK